MATRRVVVRPSQVTAAKLLVKIAEKDGRTVSPGVQRLADLGLSDALDAAPLSGASVDAREPRATALRSRPSIAHPEARS